MAKFKVGTKIHIVPTWNDTTEKPNSVDWIITNVREWDFNRFAYHYDITDVDTGLPLFGGGIGGDISEDELIDHINKGYLKVLD